ncbi:hypothetical protein MKW94_002231 [Papaver nudicaule]|uniref:SHSP domain-containing protein n=1 Tax=Papaver nudicaule TaxID=74823 RepID=A0AA42ATH0_PAPNU|nr:hypothetical protein [Papaver nudicaule]
MAATPVEMTNSYVFHIDLCGLALHNEIKVHVECEKTLVIRYGASYNRDALTKKFDLPQNANVDSTSAVFHNGILFVTVNKFNRSQVKVIRVSKAEN